MNVLRSRWFAALLVVLGLGCPAFAQDTVDMKWKFEKGKTFYQECTTETNQEMTLTQQQKVTTKQKQTFIFSWTPLEQDDKKNWKIEQKIEGVKVDIQIGTTPIQFDSTKAGGAATPLSEFFKALLGAKFTITLSPEMKITNLEGRQDFIKKLINTNQTMEPLLNLILSEDALKQMSDAAFAMVPGKPVKKGDTWERTSKLSMGPIGSYETVSKYTYEGQDEKDKNLAKIKVENTLKYTPPQAAAAGQLPFKIISADLKSKDATGTVFFDVEKGRLSSQDTSMKLEGKLSIDINSMTSEVELKQDQKTTIRTSDKNPAEAAPEKPAEKPAEKK
jgi:hypothetical protein